MKKQKNILTIKLFYNQEGFTLAELIIVIGIILSISVMMFGAAKYWIRWMKEVETKKKLNELQKAVNYVYNNYAYTIDSNSQAQFCFRLQNQNYCLTTGNASNSQNFQALQALSSVAGVAMDKPDRDAMGTTLQIFVTPRLTQRQIQYHVIAFVSPGWNTQVESIFDSQSGVLQLRGDDMGFTISGQQIETDKWNNTNEILSRLRDIYQNHFNTLYATSSNKNIYINRFANKNSSCQTSSYWDQNSLIANSNCVGGNNTLTGVGAVSAWGLTADLIYDAWGNEIRVDNSSSQTKNPDTTGLQIPYTARVYTTTPWGFEISATAVGVY